jgi:raffinose/stachyose/melibiose transport system permease protein
VNKKKVYPWWFVAIPLILYILFFLLPSVLGVFYSFTDWSRMTPKNGLHFVGLKNYSEIFSGKSQYANGILNTLKFTIISNIVKIIPALFLAILLQESVRGKNFYRTVFYLPSILPFVVIGLIFTSVFNYSNGLLNNTLDFLHMGFAKQKWLSDLHVVWKSVYMVDAWRGIGYVMTIFIAGLNAIPKEYYEAARIDGANFWQTALCDVADDARRDHDQCRIWRDLRTQGIRYHLCAHERRTRSCDRSHHNVCI